MIAYADGALELRTDAPLATLTLNRPAARNALNLAMWRDLPRAIAAVADDPAIRVLIVRGAGGHFASGADISEFATVFADRETAEDYACLIEAATGALETLKIPVIALIEGYCIGAGLAVALACDLRIGADTARLGAPPAKLGLIYSLGDTRRLVNAVGASAAKAMLFSATLHAAPEALRIGLLDEVHPGDTLEGAVMAKAQGMAGLSRWSIATTKAVVGLVLEGQATDTDATRDLFVDGATGPDLAEGLAAFREKRPPVFP
jgi:enoyl-CoA hydratase/carnithine racemase